MQTHAVSEQAGGSACGPLLQVRGAGKRFGNDWVFQGVHLEVRPGELVAVVGASGVGKSTLLNGLAGLEPLDAGSVYLHGTDVLALSEAQAAAWRASSLGFVFQAFHVLPHLSVERNIELPLLLQRTPEMERSVRVRQALEWVGLEGMGGREPRTLSGGQLQRVALARALVHRPALLLADEPTGNLDPETAGKVLRLLVEQVRAHHTACVLVTHSTEAAGLADRAVRLTPQGMVPLEPRQKEPD